MKHKIAELVRPSRRAFLGVSALSVTALAAANSTRANSMFGDSDIEDNSPRIDLSVDDDLSLIHI